MANTAEFEALSVEAKVVAGCWWGVMMTDKVGFDRPWTIHPQTRKGLDDLAAAGYLTCEPRNRYPNCPLDWKPTDKMRTERPRVSQAFLKEHSTFPITDESQPEQPRKKARA